MFFLQFFCVLQFEYLDNHMFNHSMTIELAVNVHQNECGRNCFRLFIYLFIYISYLLQTVWLEPASVFTAAESYGSMYVYYSGDGFEWWCFVQHWRMREQPRGVCGFAIWVVYSGVHLSLQLLLIGVSSCQIRCFLSRSVSVVVEYKAGYLK